ncbi:hypothetical protein D3C80_1537200 [compost metagenome]
MIDESVSLISCVDQQRAIVREKDRTVFDEAQNQFPPYPAVRSALGAPVPASAGATINSATICLIDSAPIRIWGGSQKAPSIGIQTTKRSNWYSKQVDQKIIF